MKMNIIEALALGDEGIISIVGAGGKTSLMYSLARELVAAGKRVLTTTTTKIFMPTLEESPATIISCDPEEIVQKAKVLLQEFSHLTAVSEKLQTHNKLGGLDSAAIECIQKSHLFDFIIIEADGAARRPLKACASHEPVVPVFTDYVIALAGLDVLAKPLTEEWVFRANVFSQITGIDLMADVTEDAVALALLHDISPIVANHNCKKIIFLNKAGDSDAVKGGERVAVLLEQRGKGILNRIIIGELIKEPVIHQCTIVE